MLSTPFLHYSMLCPSHHTWPLFTLHLILTLLGVLFAHHAAASQTFPPVYQARLLSGSLQRGFLLSGTHSPSVFPGCLLSLDLTSARSSLTTVLTPHHTPPQPSSIPFPNFSLLKLWCLGLLDALIIISKGAKTSPHSLSRLKTYSLTFSYWMIILF